MAVDLSLFRKNISLPGRGRLWQLAWLAMGAPLLRSSWLLGSSWRTGLLRGFGAVVGEAVILKPGLRVRYPWKLRIGDNSWVGEDCWIDNWAYVTVGSNVCLSQSVYLCTGNHDWKDRAFGMFARGITLEDGCWVASRCALGPGVRVGKNAIAAMGSIVSQDIPPYEIHGGNPASLRGMRTFNGAAEVDRRDGENVSEPGIRSVEKTQFERGEMAVDGK